MNEFDKRARMLSDVVPKLGILQEITNYLDWFFLPPPNYLLCYSAIGEANWEV